MHVDDGECVPPEKVRKHDVIEYLIPETGITETSVVLSRAARATGKKRFWWNIQVKGTDRQKSVNLEAVRDLRKLGSRDSYVIPALVVSIPRNLHHYRNVWMQRRND